MRKYNVLIALLCIGLVAAGSAPGADYIDRDCIMVKVPHYGKIPICEWRDRTTEPITGYIVADTLEEGNPFDYIGARETTWSSDRSGVSKEWVLKYLHGSVPPYSQRQAPFTSTVQSICAEQDNALYDLIFATQAMVLQGDDTTAGLLKARYFNRTVPYKQLTCYTEGFCIQ